MSSDPVRFDHPANAKILAYLEDPAHRKGSASVAVDRRSCSPGQVADPYQSLGAHPDLLERLWDQLGARLPLDCRRVVHGAPVLVHPRSGVIFGYCGGSMTYALRLPEAERSAALAAGAKRVREYPAYPALGVEASRLDLDTFGYEWVFGGWFADEDAWCRAAFDHAGAQTPPSLDRKSRQ
ncbi:MAG: hypothetical protein ACKVXR_07230 [Planctomycetota bacterium]